MVLLKDVPLLFGVHLLHFFTESQVIVSQDLETLIKPLESFQHGHASLLPKHAGNLCLLRPHGILLLLMVRIKLRVLIVAHGHWPTLVEKLGISIHRLLCIQGWGLH
jgi:hypothetical protein